MEKFPPNAASLEAPGGLSFKSLGTLMENWSRLHALLAMCFPKSHKVIHVWGFFFCQKRLLCIYLFLISQACLSKEAHSWRSGCPCNARQVSNQRAWDRKIGLWSTCCINLICLLWIMHFLGGGYWTGYGDRQWRRKCVCICVCVRNKYPMRDCVCHCAA